MSEPAPEPTQGVPRPQLEAMVRLLLDSGDLTPMGARMLRSL